MNSENFINVIKLVVEENSIKDTIKTLSVPNIKLLDINLISASSWYKSLDDENKDIIKIIISSSVRTAIFGFFCVLDGVRAIENIDKGSLELYYVKDGKKILLNNVEEDFLHDLYKSL